MPNHVAISPKDHKDLRILKERSDEMGDGMMCAVTFPEEFRSLQNQYPILFQLNQDRDEVLCLALFGFENGENLFLKDGKWDARYVPLAMDIQPFMIGVPSGDEKDRKVVIDLDSPRIGEGEGERLFDENGVATTFLDNVSKKLGYLDEGFKKAPSYIEALQKYDLLEPLSIDVTTHDGTKNRLVGFHTIHEEKFHSLDQAALGDLQSQGYLFPTYMVLASLSNLGSLIDRKDAQQKLMSEAHV
ncbi:MAG: SapC family protein [Hellea sp.]|nr:SapC family protein [Hellea sp.]